jgi:hypothetical protein
MKFKPLNKNLYWSINDENHCIGDYSKYNIELTITEKEK